MSNEAPKLPNPNAVKELRDLYNKRKEERLKKHKEFAEILKKKAPLKKIAKPDISRLFRSDCYWALCVFSIT